VLALYDGIQVGTPIAAILDTEAGNCLFSQASELYEELNHFGGECDVIQSRRLWGNDDRQKDTAIGAALGGAVGAATTGSTLGTVGGAPIGGRDRQ
jgi:hypothetical protein